MTRPNLLLFMPDQLRADAVGAFGNEVVQTPAIDALATDGVRFDQAYAQHSVCSQSRISMFTGWYPHVAGHRTLDHLLAPHEPNVFARLREGGYHVALCGARGDMLGPGVTRASCDRFGFTTPPRLADVGRWHTLPFAETDKRYYAFHGGVVDDDLFELDEATVATAVDWLGEGLPEPWCLFVPLIFPHPPFTVERRWYEPYDGVEVPAPVPPVDGKPGFHAELRRRCGLDRLDGDDWAEIARTYYAMIARVDDQLRRVREAVDGTGAADRTVTCFFTDHGEYLGEFGLVEKWPAGVDDVLVRNPLIVHDPRASSGVARSFVELVDLTATIEELAELEPAYTHFGRSLVPLLTTPSAVHRDAAFSEGGFLVQEAHLLEAGAGGPYRHKQELQHDRPDLAGKVSAIRTERWCYVHRLYEPPELYDRVADPRETENLAGRPEHATTEGELRDRLLTWHLETSDVVPWRADPRMDDDLRASMLGG